MIKDSLAEAINRQINAEMYSAYLYLSMAVDFGDKNLDGFEHWMRLQAQEEMDHAMRFLDYLSERGGRVKLDTIEKPVSGWSSPLDAFRDAYAHECKVTGMINDIMDLAEKENDRATMNMLRWFVEEQVEEESSADDIVQKLEMAGDSPGALLILNDRMARRTAGEH